MNVRTLVTALFAVMLVATPMNAAAATGPPIDFSDGKAQDVYIEEDELTVASHDLGEMDSPLQFLNDEGSVETLPASMNTSQDTTIGVRWDQVDADAYRLFPRVSGESENAHTWTNTSNWTTDANAAVADADADGVQKVEVNITAAGGNATFAEAVDLDDADKRVLTAVLNVDTLPSSANVTVRAVDSDGDYRYAVIDTDRDANDSHVIANKTADGIVFQERVGDLPMAGSGDSTMDSIVRVEVIGSNSNAKLTIAGLDLDRKSTIDFAEIERDTDSDGDLETTTFTDYWEGGVANITSYDTIGSTFDSATINDFRVYGVKYRASDLTDSDEYSVDWSSADAYGSYDQKLTATYDIEVPSAIDLSHTGLTLRADQALVSERYATVELAEPDDDEAIGDLNDTDYTSKKSLFTDGSEGDTHDLKTGASAGQDYRVHMVLLYLDGEASALQSTAAAGGPTGKSGGFFSTIWGKLTGFVAAVGATLGSIKLFGGD